MKLIFLSPLAYFFVVLIINSLHFYNFLIKQDFLSCVVLLLLKMYSDLSKYRYLCWKTRQKYRERSTFYSLCWQFWVRMSCKMHQIQRQSRFLSKKCLNKVLCNNNSHSACKHTQITSVNIHNTDVSVHPAALITKACCEICEVILKLQRLLGKSALSCFH